MTLSFGDNLELQYFKSLLQREIYFIFKLRTKRRNSILNISNGLSVLQLAIDEITVFDFHLGNEYYLPKQVPN